jgi:hypothetical protein
MSPQFDKRPPNGYKLFQEDLRLQRVAELGGDSTKLDFGALQTESSKAWGLLDDDRKKPYIDRAAKLREEFKASGKIPRPRKDKHSRGGLDARRLHSLRTGEPMMTEEAWQSLDGAVKAQAINEARSLAITPFKTYLVLKAASGTPLGDNGWAEAGEVVDGACTALAKTVNDYLIGRAKCDVRRLSNENTNIIRLSQAQFATSRIEPKKTRKPASDADSVESDDDDSAPAPTSKRSKTNGGEAATNGAKPSAKRAAAKPKPAAKTKPATKPKAKKTKAEDAYASDSDGN